MTRTQWWIFDRPIMSDPLFIAAIMIGIATAVLSLLRTDEPTPWLGAYSLLAGFASGMFATGVVAGSVRSFVRGYRGESSSRSVDEG